MRVSSKIRKPGQLRVERQCLHADRPHARAAGVDNKVRRLQAAQPAIEVGKARGHTGDAAIMVKRQLGACGSLAQRLVQGLDPAPGVSCLGEPEQTAFGLF